MDGEADHADPDADYVHEEDEEEDKEEEQLKTKIRSQSLFLTRAVAPQHRGNQAEDLDEAFHVRRKQKRARIEDRDLKELQEITKDNLQRFEDRGNNEARCLLLSTELDGAPMEEQKALLEDLLHKFDDIPILETAHHAVTLWGSRDKAPPVAWLRAQKFAAPMRCFNLTSMKQIFNHPAQPGAAQVGTLCFPLIYLSPPLLPLHSP